MIDLNLLARQCPIYNELKRANVIPLVENIPYIAKP